MNKETLLQKERDELKVVKIDYRRKRKKIKRTVRILQQLIDAGFEFSIPYEIENAFIRIEREDLPKIRKILGERLIISFKSPMDEETIKIFVHPESAPNSINFWYVKKYNGKGHCKIVEQEVVTPARSSCQFVLVCEGNS